MLNDGYMPQRIIAYRLFVVGCALALLSSCDSGLGDSSGRIYPGGQYFGEFLDLDGDRLVASAWGSDEAFVFRSDPGGFAEEDALRPLGGPGEGNYGWSLDLDGEIVVVGSPILGGERGGTVYIYEQVGPEWETAAVLVPPSSYQTERWFGENVAVSGGVVAATLGPRMEGVENTLVDSAAVVLYEKMDGQWAEAFRIQEPVFESPTALAGSGFGNGLALDADRMAVSSSGEDFGGIVDAGVVRIYERQGAAWALSAEIQPDDPATYQPFNGGALALDGSTLVATSGSRDADGLTAGRVVHVFRHSGGAWVQEAVLRPDDLARSDGFGWTLDLDGDRLAVSASGRAGFRGSAFVFKRSVSGTWDLEAEVWPEGLGEDALFGEGVALDGDRLMVGAAGVGGDQGGVFEFRREGAAWVQVR